MGIGNQQVAQEVKNLPADAGSPASIPGSEDPLKEEMETYYSILAWRILWTEEPGGLQPMVVTVLHD